MEFFCSWSLFFLCYSLYPIYSNHLVEGERAGCFALTIYVPSNLVSVVVDSLFIVVPIVCGCFAFAPCFVVHYLVFFCLVLQSSHGYLTLIVSLMPCGG